MLLVNPTDQLITGNVVMDATYPYSIAPRSATKVISSNPSSVQTGTILVQVAANSLAPIASSVFSFVSGGVIVTESGIGATGVSQSFLIFAELDSAQSLQTGIAIANTSSNTATVRFALLTPDGLPSGYSTSTTIGGNGHLALFLRDLPGFQNLPASFRGVLRISADAPISAIGLRERYNERNDFLISTTPAIAANAAASTIGSVFPQVVIGGGYTTELILINSGASSGGTMVLMSQTGAALPLQLR